jgi:hypothetical protein
MIKTKILRKNLFESCLAPEPNLDPNKHENQDLDLDRNKVGLDTQDWFEVSKNPKGRKEQLSTIIPD